MALGFPLQAVQEPLVPCHQVFVNFRGAELRHNFISHLEPALKTVGINVFVDNNEKRGEDLTALFRRIEESKIALVVFSRRYMESIWCLNELVKIKERADEKKLLVIPIFFKVKPTELKGLLDEACESHGILHKAHILNKWKVALECIKSKTGFPLKDKRY
ncbi:PREDICTED: protein PHLOEM PROTEIN 2-LIKE A5-like [Camelina sativa]|uniref:Protein PHLOEM PROTEIN 2-LIKE A5-like n=1 Tax=Camelina sativa TaxID=90675 RepID=A0ABM0USZ6_CAMSA|nr:PREDICTED: protein PHLOEM PROTEIN 2-LIKE A5-like [Camelina sativa]